MDKLGKLIADARKEHSVSIEQLAKSVDCSLNYARHLQSNPHTVVSERLAYNLNAVLKIPHKLLDPAVEARNKAGRAFYAEYRAKNKKASKKEKKKGA